MGICFTEISSENTRGLANHLPCQRLEPFCRTGAMPGGYSLSAFLSVPHQVHQGREYLGLCFFRHDCHGHSTS